MKIAIIGAGISGNLAARLLATQHEVQLFEAGNYLGGHANTVQVTTPSGAVQVDTGFMVFNRRTYPNFCRMLEILGVECQPSDMSFSVHCDASGLEYNGSSLNGLFAQRSNLLNPRFHRLVRDILWFNRAGETFATTSPSDDGTTTNGTTTLGEFLSSQRLGPEVRQNYLIPMLSAIWSAAPDMVERLPARFILGFMHNHGLMQLRDRPMWRTIVGGSKRYVQALLAPIADRIRIGSRVVRIERRIDAATVHLDGGQEEQFDAVVLATHADQSLAVLAEATRDERDILTAFPYQKNSAVLHSDTGPMPTRRRAWASWNYRIAAGDPTTSELTSSAGLSAASVTYDLNRLQNLPTDQPLFVTLNPVSPINSQLIHREFSYDHPAFSLQSVAAQDRWEQISGPNRTYYCGAYWGYGFHEDGVNRRASRRCCVWHLARQPCSR